MKPEQAKGAQNGGTSLPNTKGIRDVLSLAMNVTAEHREAVQGIRETRVLGADCLGLNARSTLASCVPMGSGFTSLSLSFPLWKV